MKLTKIFGIVLSLHVVVILLVMFQPGCQTTDKKQQPVTNQPTGTQDPPSGKPAFNQGVGNPSIAPDVPSPGQEPELAEPTRPGQDGIIVPGLTPVPEDPSPVGDLNLTPTNVSVYKVQRGDTLWAIAQKNGFSLGVLLKANQSLDKNSRLAIGQEILLPVGGVSDIDTPVEAVVPQSDGQAGSYVVKSGDSLTKIAQVNGVSLSSLLQANGLSKSSIIRPGQNLVIPEGGTSPAVSASSIVVPSDALTHTVKKGDNLTRIAAIYGTTVKRVMELNGLSDPGKIQIGQNLIVSDSGSTTPSPSEPEVIVPADPDASLQDFFEGKVDKDRPVIDIKE
jgi:LysM repeat protein